MKTVLTPEESQRLIALGVDPKLASNEQYVESDKILNGIELPPELKPCFNLTDILSILPKEIEIDGKKENLNIVMDNYGALVGYPEFHEKHGCAFVVPELIDALYQLLIWVIASGHLKIEK